MAKLVSPGVYVREVDLSQMIHTYFYKSKMCGIGPDGKKWYRITEMTVEVRQWIANAVNNGDDEFDDSPVITEEQFTMLSLKFPNVDYSDTVPFVGDWKRL